MKKSMYSLEKRNYIDNKYSLVYNTLTKAVAAILIDDWDKIGTTLENTISEKTISQLKENGFIVQDNDNENSRLNMYFTNLKSQYYSYASMVLTSYACNMNCPYCFENHIKDNKNTMSSQTAHDVSKWLQNEFIQYRPKFAGIAFSGGEPLFNKKAVSILISELKTFCDLNEINFSFGFLTNGTISISTKEAKEYSRCGIEFIQYTIDGNRDVNDKRRIIEGGSYDKILSNIKRNDKLMKLNSVVRVNIDQENIGKIDMMLDDLKSLSIRDLSLDYAVRFETPCDIFSSNQTVLEMKDLPHSILECQKITKERGIAHSRRFTSDSPCLAIVPRQFVIDPLGELYKCAAFAGEKEFVVGSIYDDQMNEKYIDMVGHDAWQDCKSCPYVPLCGGGCLFLNRNQTGDFKERKCNKYLFSNIVMETLASSLNQDDLRRQLELEERGQFE